MKSDILTRISIVFIKLLALLPFRLLYMLSDIIFPIVYYLIEYRKKVVFQNLKNAFPNKPEQEIKQIARRFYRHFCDMTFETLKMSRMRMTDFGEKMKITNAEIVNRYFDEGKSVLVLTAHYNNWEWGCSLPAVMKHKTIAVYRPLKDKEFDRFMNKNRSIGDIEMVKDDQILKRLLKAKSNGELVLTWLAADQTPPSFHKNWYYFLNQEALFFPGPAVISKKFNQPVFYQHIEKITRGKYISTYELLIENPYELSETEITKIYIKRMEEIIRKKPEYYLWSHRRWKHKRPPDVNSETEIQTNGQN